MIAGNSTSEKRMSLLTLERNSPSPQDSESEDQLSCSSYEGFVAKEGCVMCLSPRPGASVGKHGGSLRIIHHLRRLLKLMRDQDTIKLAVELEKSKTRSIDKYLVVIATTGVQDTEETIVLGTEQDKQTSRVKVCLFLPLWRDTEIKLNGDGGFSVNAGDNTQIFKPRSVQSMWTALQVLFKATDVARLNNYYVGGLSHTWMMYYKAQLTDDGIALTEWNLQEDVESFRPFSPESNDPSSLAAEDKLKKHLVSTLKELMLHADLEEVTSRQLRLEMEKQLQMDLKGYRGFLDQQMMYILGQMEKPSQIQEYLFLGSEWNAANLIELKQLGIGYILNMTREIDNFYPEAFKYKTIRLFDVPESDLLKHWDDTYKFIKEAKQKESKVLVHCKMGVSRSASTTMAYMMKEYRMTLEEAFDHVKSKRNVVNPNHGFMSQLKAYEGILNARYNKIFGLQVPSRLSLHSRSSSDPNLKCHLTTDLDDAQGGYAPDTKDPMFSPPIQDSLQMRSCSAILSGEFDEHSSEALESRVANSLPPEKAEGMKSYLASLPPVMLPEDDMDQGITVPSPSDSGSPYSSPFLTPPDDEHITQLLKLYQETNRAKVAVEAVEARQESSSEVNNASVQSSSMPTSQGSTTQNPVDRQPVAVVERTVVSPSTHARTTRTASLPISLRSRANLGMFAPRSPLFPPLEDKVITEDCSAPPAEDVGVTVCSNAAKTVQDRIKEIEGLNSGSQLRSAPLERPESETCSPHGSTNGKRISGGSLTNASSDESLASPRFSQLVSADDATISEKSLPVSTGRSSSADEITYNSKSPFELLRRSVSPLPPVEQEPSNTHQALQSPLETAPSEQSFRKWSPSADKAMPTVFSPSNVSPSSSSTQPLEPIVSMTVNNQGKMASLMTGSLTTPNSPGTQYKNASRAAAQLAQQRGLQPPKVDERDISASADNIWDSSVTKGVKELSSIFGGGSLGRSWSMRERQRPVLPIYKRKVSGSVSPSFDTEHDSD